MPPTHLPSPQMKHCTFILVIWCVSSHVGICIFYHSLKVELLMIPVWYSIQWYYISRQSCTVPVYCIAIFISWKGNKVHFTVEPYSDNSIFCTFVCITVILWVPGARLKHSVPLVQYTEDCDGCQVVVAQWWEHWWLKSVALDSIPSDYQPAYFHFPLSALFSMWGEISKAVILYIYVTYLMVISYIQ